MGMVPQKKNATSRRGCPADGLGRAARWVLALWVLASLSVRVAKAEEPTETTIKTVLDESPFISARAAGMGGALSTLADGPHAPFYNPAGIGGIHWERNNPPLVRQFHFPYLGVGANSNATDLRKDFSSQEGSTDTGVGNAIADAGAGKRQYGRMSTMFNIVFSRFVFLHAQDTQLAAFKNSALTDTPASLSTAYRSQSTSGLGFSVTNPGETLYLGAFSGFVSRSLINGDFAYDELVSRQERTSAFAGRANSYSGMTSHVGMLWILGKYGRPALALVAKNVGNAYYNLQSASTSNPPTSTRLRDDQDMTLGFSYSPRVGRSGALNMIFEGHHLTHKDIAVSKKFRAALELNLGGFGSMATFGVRAGVNQAGVSAGINLNLGLIQIEAATQAEDIGIGNRSYSERRNLATFAVNVLDEY